MDWTMGSFIEEACQRVRQQVGDEKVVLGLSGGVDSSVTAALLHKAIGDQLTCIFVNNGLLRAREEEIVQRVFGENFHVRLKYIDATERFLAALKGVTDPEQKRKIIGEQFIRVFEDAIVDLAKENQKSEIRNQRFRFLAQGTLYPDVIESVSIAGNPAAVIKSHHNVGGLPEKMHFELVEPVRQLFKDEVRQDPDSPSASSARLRRNDCRSCAMPTSSCKAKWKRLIGITKSGNHSPCCCQCARSGSWAINALTKTQLCCRLSKVRTA